MVNKTSLPIPYQLSLSDSVGTGDKDFEQELIKIANVYKTESKLIDICLANRLIQVGKIYSKIKTEKRNFRIFNDIPEFTHSNLDAAIALSKIKDIEKICVFGWKKLYYLYINSTGIKYSTISIESIQNEFGDITEESVEKGFIKSDLRSNKIDAQKINEYWNDGLRLEMLQDKRNISRIQKTDNAKETISQIKHRFEEKNISVVKNDYDIYEKNILKSTKTKIMMNKTQKYDHIIDEDILMNDINSSIDYQTRIMTIIEQREKDVSEFFDNLLAEM